MRKFIGENLRKAMDARGLTEIALGKLTEAKEKKGIQQSYVSALINGKKKNPRPVMVERLAKALGINSEFFYDADARLPQDLLPPNMDDELIQFIKDANNIPWIRIAKEQKESGVTEDLALHLARTLKETRR